MTTTVLNPYHKYVAQRARIVEMREKNQCATLQQIGDKFGLSRERVRQILKGEHSSTKHYGYGSRTYCSQCGGRIHPSNRSGWCQKCYHSKAWTLVECEVCGTMFSKRVSELASRARTGRSFPRFCGRRCLGRATAKAYGFKPLSQETIEKVALLVGSGYSLHRAGLTLGVVNPHQLKSRVERVLGYSLPIRGLSVRKRYEQRMGRRLLVRVMIRWLWRLGFTEREIVSFGYGKASVWRAKRWSS